MGRPCTLSFQPAAFLHSNGSKQRLHADPRALAETIAGLLRLQPPAAVCLCAELAARVLSVCAGIRRLTRARNE